MHEVTSCLLLLLEPSRGALQGPQARQEAQSHRSPEEQAATSRRGLVHGERERPRQGARSGPEQELCVRGSAACSHGYKLRGRIQYVPDLLYALVIYLLCVCAL